MNKFLENVVAWLPYSVQPYAKSLVPVVVAGAVAVQDLTVSAVEVSEVKTLAVGALTSIVVALIPNLVD